MIDNATMHTVKQDLTDHPGVPGDPRFRRQFATWPMHETELITAVTETRCISWDALVPRQPEWVPHSGICSPFLKVKGALLWNKWYLDKQLLMTSASVTVSSIWRHHKGDRLTSATLQSFCKLRPEPLKIAASVVLAEFQSSDCVPKLAKFGMFAELFFPILCLDNWTKINKYADFISPCGFGSNLKWKSSGSLAATAKRRVAAIKGGNLIATHSVQWNWVL